MKIKFNSDDELPVNKTTENSTMTIVVKAVFYENNKYYLQVFLDKCYIVIELTFLKELMLIKQAH